MENYWLSRKTSREVYRSNVNKLIGGNLEEMDLDSEDEFVDLSGVTSAGGRYKAYDDLRRLYVPSLGIAQHLAVINAPKS